jgi:hypothetical protein
VAQSVWHRAEPSEERFSGAVVRIPQPSVRDSQPLQAAVLDFYKSWLIEQKPQLALSYMSVKANACIAAFATGESANDGMIRLRLFGHMRKANQEPGDVGHLNDVLHAVVTLAPDSRPIEQPDGGLFYLANLTDSLARRLDCRKTFDVPLAEDLPRAEGSFGDYYSAFTVIRSRDHKDSGQPLFQVWHREEGSWKIVSWHLKNPLDHRNGPQLAGAQDAESGGAKTDATDPQLLTTVQRFLQVWLVNRDLPATLKSVAPEAQPCAISATAASTASTPAAEQRWFSEVAAEIPKRDTLTNMIERVEFSHARMREVKHPDQNSYLLVQISDDLASMYNCMALRGGITPRATANGTDKTFYTLNTYQTMFQPRHTDGDRGTVVLTWARRQDRWMIISFDVLTY